MSDFTFAMRQLVRRPWHTFAVVMCLAAGLTVPIAAVSILTSMVYGEQPGVVDREATVRVFLSYDTSNGRRTSRQPLSLDDFNVFRQEVPAIGTLAAEGDLRMAAVGRHGPVGLTGAFVSGNYFKVLGTVPLAGRLLTDADERPDAPPVAVVSEHFWRLHLDQTTDSMGSTILVAGRSFTVIGVAPPRFHGVQPIDIGADDSQGLQLWMPLQHATLWPGIPASREPWLTAVGRRREGNTTADVLSQLAPVAGQLAGLYPSSRANAAVAVRGHSFGPEDIPLEVLIVIAGMLCVPLTVLAIASANVANLQLARAAERARELTVRLSLGATRARLIRFLTVETLALAAVAIAVSTLATAVIMRFAEPYFPIDLSIDWRVAAFSLVLLLAVTIATGLAPAWHVMRGFDTARLKQTVQGGGLTHSRLRSSLVVAQVALSLVMLSAGIVFLGSVQSIELDAPDSLRKQIVVEFDPSQAGSSAEEANRFANDLQIRLQNDPRVEAVSLSRSSSVRYGTSDTDRSNDRYAAFVEITPSWLKVMKLPILAGRALNDTDRSGNDMSVIVSDRLADMITPGESPLGKLFYLDDGKSAKRVEIVGVVADNRNGPMRKEARPDPAIYAALPLSVTGPFTIRIGTPAVDGVRADLPAIVHELNPRLPWLTMRRGEENFLTDAREMQSLALAITGLGLIALTLAATGLYAVMSYVVTLRRREIGVRIAVGANPRQIVQMIVREALRLVLIGGLIGLSLAIPLAFLLRAFIVETVTLDPVVFVSTLLLLLGVGLIAAALPARTASRVDPIKALRLD